MNSLIPLFCLFALISGPVSYAAEKEKKRFVLYAEFIENTPVELSDGAKWMMEKGDCFPVYMYKDRQTKVVLQLAAATFVTETYRVRILKESEHEQGMESYRKMVDSYLKTKTEKWKQEVKK